MLKKLKQINSKIKFKNPWWTYKVDNYEMPNGNTSEYHYVSTFGSTFIIPITEENKFILVKQFRYLNNDFSIEFPGGGQKENISPLENAILELKEETGFTSNKIVELGVFNPYNGVTNEICRIFLATELVKGESNPEESEEIEVLELSEIEIDEMIKKNEIWDGMTLAAWSIFKFKKEIFL